LCSRVFIAEKVDGVGYKGSGETTMVDVQTVLEAFLSGRKQNFQSWNCSPEVPNYQNVQIKGFYCIYLYIIYCLI